MGGNSESWWELFALGLTALAGAAYYTVTQGWDRMIHPKEYATPGTVTVEPTEEARLSPSGMYSNPDRSDYYVHYVTKHKKLATSSPTPSPQIRIRLPGVVFPGGNRPKPISFPVFPRIPIHFPRTDPPANTVPEWMNVLAGVRFKLVEEGGYD